MIKEKLAGLIRKAIIDLQGKGVLPAFPISEIKISQPPDKELGDFSSTITLSIASQVRQEPEEIANKIAETLRELSEFQNLCEKVEVAKPGFLNFFLSANHLLQEVSSILKQRKPPATKKQTLLIEYSQPNTHKEFHIGHLRNVALSSALINLYRLTGFKVIPVNYIGDIGAHVAKCLWGLSKVKSLGEAKSKGEYLGKIYVWATKQVEEHPEYKKEINLIQQKLESGDKRLLALWKKTREWSLKEFKKIYKELGAEFDHYFFESKVEKEGKKIVKELLEKGIAQKGEGGAIIVDLKKYGLDVFIILKSDGTSLYSTKDLALAKRKFQKFKIDQSLHIIDIRQSFYLKQLFKTLELWGFKNPMQHIAYEFVQLKEGVISSRLGRTILYEDLRDQMILYAQKETQKRHADWGKDKIEKNALALALGAMKFGMIRVSPKQIITFDIKEALSFDGFTGPYLQYSVARIYSIFKKVQCLEARPPKEAEPPQINRAERKLLLKLATFQDAISLAAEQSDPSTLAKYLYELSQNFSSFYETCPVLKAEDQKLKEFRLQIVYATRLILEKGMQILGLPILKEM